MGRSLAQVDVVGAAIKSFEVSCVVLVLIACQSNSSNYSSVAKFRPSLLCTNFRP